MFNDIQILFLGGGADVLISQGFCIIFDNFARLIAEMIGRCHVCIRILTELITEMIRTAEFHASSIIDQQNSNIIAHMAISHGVEIVEESQIAHDAKMKIVR